MNKQQKSNTGWYFLGIVVLMHIALLIIEPEKVTSSLTFSLKTVYRVLPALIIVFVLMVIINFFMESKHIQRYLGRSSGVKGWLFAIISGIISTGPIYMWYPVLRDLKTSGVRTALISVFLYSRSVKLPLLPLLITYFGLTYTIVLNLAIVCISPLQGWLVEKIAEGMVQNSTQNL
jgi:uncharacterized membrane protein YraQ (UPF0718 family)